MFLALDRYNRPVGEVSLVHPNNLAIDPRDETLYITDGSQLLKVSKDGIVKPIAGAIPFMKSNLKSKLQGSQMATDAKFEANLVIYFEYIIY